MTQYVKKLPAVFQTVTEKKFFDATFDQVLSKKDSDYLAGYLGRRDPGKYNPISDFYIPEPSKNRTWWQLEPTAFSRTEDGTRSNIFFYEDLLDNIEYYGGNTLNQDRLFNSEYYSFGPPIDYDMFVNYHDYYWVDQRLPVITITGVTSADIIGQETYTTPPSASPANLTLSSGMSIILADDPAYLNPHTVENLGGCDGLQLVPYFTDITAGATFEFLPWDGSITLSNGRTVTNNRWDSNTWDTQYRPSTGDYITIGRGAVNRNAWSRTNKWFHIDTIKTVISVTGGEFPQTATRALRPIIQFNANLELYNSGTQFNSEIDYGFRDYPIGGNPIRFTEFQNQNVNVLNTTYSMSLSNGDLVCFFNDDTEIDINVSPWNTFGIDGSIWAGMGFQAAVNKFIFRTIVDITGTVSFLPYTSWYTPVSQGDIVIIKEDGPGTSAQAGETWYFDSDEWQKAFNDKVRLNQPPLFQLYDHENIKLNDTVKYPENNFQGNKIFSYKINPTPGATADPVLGFPIVYSGFGQASDIVFENNLITNRYFYDSQLLQIDGYYYYKEANDPVLRNAWNLYNPCECSDSLITPVNCVSQSKQRVIDKYVVGFGTLYQFKLSVTPYGYPARPDIIVSVNGIEVKNSTEQINGYTISVINNSIYVDLNSYLSTMLTVPQAIDPVVEIQTYTHDSLDPLEPGYSSIPQQLEANPNQEEVGEITGSDLTDHFVSIIKGQAGFEGSAFGGPNNYRDTRKNQSIGQKILQNTTPLLKTMLVSAKGDLSFIDAVRFSSEEYNKFKNRYMKIAQQLINTGFNPVQYQNKTVIVSFWVEEILKQISVSKEFSNAFAYSYMIANGSPFATQTFSAPVAGNITLSGYVDLSDSRNALYIYEVENNGKETLLLVDRDYRIVSESPIEIEFINPISPTSTIYTALYRDPIPAYIPSTPSKLGSYPVYEPRMEWDSTYVSPTWVIIGHDGSKTIAYGSPTEVDYRDQLLLELEKRIYNLIKSKFRKEYYLPIRLETVKPGFFREGRYSRQEYLDITVSYINKWSAKNRANYRANDWYSASATTPVDKLWKLYNYRNAVDLSGAPLNLPGNWKGIFQYLYDTYNPDTRPWEMLGFSIEPDWWRFEYGNPLINTEGQEVWGSLSAGAHNMYEDLEAGIIRQGPSAEYDPDTLLPIPQKLWARPGLSNYIPVDSAGEIIPVFDVTNPANSLFEITYSGDPYEPFDDFDADWTYGDGSPVEQAWMLSPTYSFSVQEFLFLMVPASYGEYMWDTLGTQLSPGYIDVPDSAALVRSSKNWQYVQNGEYSYDDNFFKWMRPKNKDQVVHAENIDGSIQIRYGYQRWISDRILFLGKAINSTFGQKVRALDVNLANKLAGFTNKDTTNTYIESISADSLSNSLIIPSNNFDVLLHKSPSVETYTYSGVIIRALGDGTFVVYGYDLLSSSFTILERSTSKLIEVEVGGTPADFAQYANGTTYNAGDIVRYNGVYYQSNATQSLQKFSDGAWSRLRTLPTVGGISVSYKPVSKSTTISIPYGSVLKSVQEVFDFLIGWGAYLESRGWKFDEVNQDTNQISDWLYAGKQFLFWLNSDWAPDASIQLSPLANKATLEVSRGYPDDVESISNGIYSILDKFGTSIPPDGTATDREGRLISVSPVDLSVGGIYFLQINVSETEHILIFDNETNFNDIVYSPLLRVRQQRLRFNGFRSNGWYGKMEAPGYLVIDNQLAPNFDTIVDAMRYYYDPDVIIDNPSLEDLGRHLIGYESKSYLDNLQVSNDVQYLFYQGAIRQKGTIQALDKLFRSTNIQTDENIEIFEEWALKVGDFGNTVEQVSTEISVIPEQNTGEVIVARLNYKPSHIGFVKQINILNAQILYTSIPVIQISAPDVDPTDPALTEIPRPAKAFAVLDSKGLITRIDINDPGYGYLSPPTVTIVSPQNALEIDKAYSVWQGEIVRDQQSNNIIEIDIDDTNLWKVKPVDPEYSLEFPLTSFTEYPIPNAGYVSFDDVDYSSFDVEQTVVNWGTQGLNPGFDDTVWIAKTFTEDWDVYKMVLTASNGGIVTVPESFDVFADTENLLWLRTSDDFLITPQFVTTGDVNTDLGNLLVLQVTERQAEAVANISPPTRQATAEAFVPIPATGLISSLGGALSDSVVQGNVSIIQSGNNYSTAPAVSIDPPAKRQANLTGTYDNTTGTINSISIVDGGLGYTAGTTVSVGLPSAATATATASVNVVNGTVTGITVDNPGLGYYSPDVPTITIEPPGEQAVATSSVSPSTGSVISMNITSAGAGYTTAPALTVAPVVKTQATANLAFSGGSVISINIANQGQGYAFSPTVNIPPPPMTQATADAVLAGDQVANLTLTLPGAGYITPPTVTISPPTFVQATATSGWAGGSIQSVTVTNGGSGYALPPTITIFGNGSGAILQAVVSNGTVTAINVISGGGGYSFPPILTVAPPAGFAATATASIDSNFGILSLTLTGPGGGYTSPPTVTIGPPNAIPATATSTVSGGRVNSVTLTNQGSGYTSPVVATIDAPNGTDATATAIVSSGAVTGINITNPGGGYTSNPSVTVAPPTGLPATATAVLLGGSLASINVTYAGEGYTRPPKVTISPPVVEAATATVSTFGGRITGYTITNPGKGYVSNPTITASLPNGVTATAVTSLTGDSVTGITITDGGSGYSSIPLISINPCPNANQVTGLPGPVNQLIITDPGEFFPRLSAPEITIVGDGVGASAVAIMDPLGSGQIIAINITNPGTGYTFADVVIEPPPGSGSGEVTSVDITVEGAGYDTVPNVTITDPTPGAGGAVLSANISSGRVLTISVINPGSGYENPTIVIDPPTNFVPSSNFAVAFEYDRTEAGFNYYRLQTLIGTPIEASDIDNYENFNKLLLFKTLRFWEQPSFGSIYYLETGDKIWVDGVNLPKPQWSVYNVGNTDYTLFRSEEKLINTKLFESASIFDSRSRDMLALLPVYDPFKDILPGPAIQNISYMSLKDPARYNVTTDSTLFSENINFAEKQVGQLWWDQSSTRYVYYEQPRWLNPNGTVGEDATTNLEYRRNHWGNLFPGSSVDIYEWTRSPVPPAQYTGTGTPRSTDTYVQTVTINKFTNIEETNYYFWVLNPTDKPNLPNRTLAASDVSRMIQSPKSQGFMFFAPIQQTENSNSYMFYNVQEILAYRGNNVQIQYRLSNRDDQPHTQWAFFRENDPTSTVTNQFWNKMVDSLCGYTKPLPISNEYDNSIIIDGEEILPVPDPALGISEKYGIEYRPRQSMFVNLNAARKVFVQSANNLLKYIPIRDDNPTWNADVSTSEYWTYTNWYRPGFENVQPNVSFQTLADATAAMNAGQLQPGDIVFVVEGTADNRYVLYAVTQLNPNIPALSLEEVGIENSAIKLLDTVYTTVNKYNLPVELRQLLNAFRTEVMVDENIVDQNKLFFSMINYVLSEQKTPNWLFKSSYIYIKENNVALNQSQLYLPNQIENVVQYINDAKPYHTQIRDYTARYTVSDISEGTAVDFGEIIVTTIDPDNINWDITGWDTFEWDMFNTIIQNIPLGGED